jgi:hypothetical protein
MHAVKIGRIFDEIEIFAKGILVCTTTQVSGNLILQVTAFFVFLY